MATSTFTRGSTTPKHFKVTTSGKVVRTGGGHITGEEAETPTTIYKYKGKVYGSEEEVKAAIKEETIKKLPEPIKERYERGLRETTPRTYSETVITKTGKDISPMREQPSSIYNEGARPQERLKEGVGVGTIKQDKPFSFWETGKTITKSGLSGGMISQDTGYLGSWSNIWQNIMHPQKTYELWSERTSQEKKAGQVVTMAAFGLAGGGAALTTEFLLGRKKAELESEMVLDVTKKEEKIKSSYERGVKTYESSVAEYEKQVGEFNVRYGERELEQKEFEKATKEKERLSLAGEQLGSLREMLNLQAKEVNKELANIEVSKELKRKEIRLGLTPMVVGGATAVTAGVGTSLLKSSNIFPTLKARITPIEAKTVAYVKEVAKISTPLVKDITYSDVKGITQVESGFFKKTKTSYFADVEGVSRPYTSPVTIKETFPELELTMKSTTTPKGISMSIGRGNIREIGKDITPSADIRTASISKRIRGEVEEGYSGFTFGKITPREAPSPKKPIKPSYVFSKESSMVAARRGEKEIYSGLGVQYKLKKSPVKKLKSPAFTQDITFVKRLKKTGGDVDLPSSDGLYYQQSEIKVTPSYTKTKGGIASVFSQAGKELERIKLVKAAKTQNIPTKVTTITKPPTPSNQLSIVKEQRTKEGTIFPKETAFDMEESPILDESLMLRRRGTEKISTPSQKPVSALNIKETQEIFQPLKESQLVTTGTKISDLQLQKTSQLQLQLPRQEQITQLTTPFVPIPSPKIAKFPPLRPIPFLPPFDLPSPFGEGGKKGKGKGLSQPKAYIPSLTAVGLEIKGIPKGVFGGKELFSGLEIRPIPTYRKRRRK